MENVRCGGLSRNTIKLIAMFTMLLNHIAAVFLKPGTLPYEILTMIGYFAAITMCYFLVEGYEYTRSKKRYGLRLLVFAVISQLPFDLAFTKDGTLSFVYFNMLFTLFLCFAIIYVMKEHRMYGRAGLAVGVLTIASVYSDWGILAPLFTILFVNARKDREEQKRAWIKSIAAFGIISALSGAGTMTVTGAVLYGLGCMVGPALAGICIHCFYSGKLARKGNRFSKWFFYLFYPVHLLVLGGLRLAGI